MIVGVKEQPLGVMLDELMAVAPLEIQETVKGVLAVADDGTEIVRVGLAG